MKRKIFFLVSGLLLAMAANVKGSDLYVYGTGTDSYPLSSVKKLTFTSNSLTIDKTDGAVTVLFDDLKFFSMKNFSTLTSRVQTKEKAKVSLYPNPVVDELSVANLQHVSAVTLLDLQGRKLQQLTPAGGEMKMSLSSYPSGVYLLQIAGENSISVEKIIKK